MKHTIDTKAIQELAAMSPEVKVYLERVFPEDILNKRLAREWYNCFVVK